MGAKPGEVVDHINRNRLDNSLENLRIVTQSENVFNKSHQKNNKSGYRGVSWTSREQKWRAVISKNKKQKHIGYFENKDEAYAAYLIEFHKWAG